MSVMSIRVDDEKRKMLKVIASVEGKTMSSIVEDLINQFIEKNKAKLLENNEINSMMKLSEKAFADWDNEEDAVYDHL